jgi:transcriptional regulator with XRE-family HTH domain
MDVLQEVLRIRSHLRKALRKKGLTQREVERRLGLARGRLSRLLGGHARLSLRQALEILAAAGVAAEQFFAEVYGLRPGEPPRGGSTLGGIPVERWLEELEELRQRLAPAAEQEPAGPQADAAGPRGRRRG